MSSVRPCVRTSAPDPVRQDQCVRLCVRTSVSGRASGPVRRDQCQAVRQDQCVRTSASGPVRQDQCGNRSQTHTSAFLLGSHGLPRALEMDTTVLLTPDYLDNIYMEMLRNCLEITSRCPVPDLRIFIYVVLGDVTDGFRANVFRRGKHYLARSGVIFLSVCKLEHR